MHVAQNRHQFVQLRHAIRRGAIVGHHHNAVFIQFTTLVSRFHLVLTLENYRWRFNDALLFFHCRDFDHCAA
ncbi:Uncharacterised protein [Vibrio cholerae]|nr:Uncharacterised protein [Vibrio cholerae]